MNSLFARDGATGPDTAVGGTPHGDMLHGLFGSTPRDHSPQGGTFAAPAGGSTGMAAGVMTPDYAANPLTALFAPGAMQGQPSLADLLALYMQQR